MNLVKTDIRTLNSSLLTDFFIFLDVSEKTMATYRRALKQLFVFFHKNNISTPTYDSILLFKKELESRKCKSATIALYLAAARRFFSWCEQKNIFPNIAVGVKAPRQERGHKRDFLGAKQLKLVLSTIERDTLSRYDLLLSCYDLINEGFFVVGQLTDKTLACLDVIINLRAFIIKISSDSGLLG